jgi:hypothetical protein
MCWIVDELAMETLDSYEGMGVRDFGAFVVMLLTLLLWVVATCDLAFICLASTSICHFRLGGSGGICQGF